MCFVVRLQSEGTQRVQHAVRKNARHNASGADEQCDKHEADRHGVHDLQKRRHKLRAVEKIYDVPNAECERGDDGRFSLSVAAECLIEKAAENELFQKTDAQHTENIQHRDTNGKLLRDTAPEIHRRDDSQREIVKIPPRAAGRTAEPEVLSQAVLPEPQEKKHGHRRAERRSYRVFGKYVRKIFRRAQQNNVNADPDERKSEFVFFIQLPHS